ncbi:MAG TPA: 1,4-dihydroxy-2-naphthoate polyprenyltransferase [Dermatophilaceae bacterium]|nr:1,4-dihydroxy-2-naphthoate polyprenyltransferase [Dermatophilaceae bacterium]
MARLSEWVAGARPRTLPAAVAPVAIGTGAAAAAGAARWDAAGLALLVAMALQVGVNYANDYSDGIRGTDTRRVGPVRLVGQGLAEPDRVRQAAFLAFGVAAAVGLLLVALTGTLWLIAVGAGAILAAWFYTGGSRPYGYAGLGEVFVFLFFGLVATLGTTYTQALRVTPTAWAGAVGVGALSCAILMANNLRDIPGDRLVGKQTLAVRLGDSAARRAYLGLLAGAGIASIGAGIRHPGALAGLLAFGWAVPAVRVVRSGARGTQLIPVLVATGRVSLAYGLLTGLGLLLCG